VRIKKIDHVAVAVTDVDAACAKYKEVLGLEPTVREVVESQKTEAVLLPIGETSIELISPKGNEGLAKFLGQRAAAAPQACLIGIEIKRKWAYRVAQRCQRRGLPRIKVFGADIRQALPALRPAGSLARVFLHFPDPWWKKRHEKRRLVGEATLDELARLLRPRGVFFVQTDVEERAREYQQQLEQHPSFSLDGGGWLADNPYGARSNREQRAIEDGLPIYRVLAYRL
jgi:tRNA (guanine-N7-)-methyltransferase